MADITPPASYLDLLLADRDIAERFTVLMQTSGGLLSLIGEENATRIPGDDRKTEWIESIQDFERDTLNNGGAVAAADTTFIVSNIEKFQVGMIIRFSGYSETMLVTGVNTATSTLTVTREYNGISAPTSIADESYVRISSRPVGENSRSNINSINQNSTEYNYYQTFREDLNFSDKLMTTKQYGETPEQFVARNDKLFMNKMRMRLLEAAMFGTRAAPVAGTTNPQMRGLAVWLRQSGANYEDLTGSDITAAKINDMLERVYTDDTEARNMVLYMNFHNARKLAAFNTTLANRIEQAPYDGNVAAGAVHKSLFRGDLAAYGDTRIVVDKQCPADSIFILNTNKISIQYTPNGRIQTWDSKPNDAPPSEKQVGYYMEATLKIRDHKYSHGLIYGTSTS